MPQAARWPAGSDMMSMRSESGGSSLTTEEGGEQRFGVRENGVELRERAEAVAVGVLAQLRGGRRRQTGG